MEHSQATTAQCVGTPQPSTRKPMRYFRSEFLNGLDGAEDYARIVELLESKANTHHIASVSIREMIDAVEYDYPVKKRVSIYCTEIIKMLVSCGIISVYEHGSGNKPNRYKLTPTDQWELPGRAIKHPVIKVSKRSRALRDKRRADEKERNRRFQEEIREFKRDLDQRTQVALESIRNGGPVNE